MRLDKFICQVSSYSRSEAKVLLKKGSVAVNGLICKDGELKIDENQDSITINGKEICYQKYYYYLLHKPAGCITACEDPKEKTVMDFLKDAPGKNLAPVGRLDKDTEGLLLITNDGALSHNLLSPKKHIPKTYFVRCNFPFSVEDMQKLEEGVDIGDEKRTKPAKVKRISDNEMELTITEGRFHQVKRMLYAISNEVVYLKRISMGNLKLPEDIKCGKYRELTPDELIILKESL